MKPKVILYNAVSLDARIDWLPLDIGLYYSIVPRWKEDATLAGCETLLEPWEPIPEETDEDLAPPQSVPDDHRPLLVTPDTRGRLRIWHYLKRQPYWRDWISLCSDATPPEHLEYLRHRHVHTLIAGHDHVDFPRALEELGERFGIGTIRLDTGGTLNGVLLRMGLVDEVHLLLHPSLVGGLSPKSFFRAPDLTSPDGVIPLRLTGVEEQAGGVILVSYDVVR
jgi:2,5-diamino-6-(ribosylamino)-4(3H)-pyrimidinone 5'-phosphate reductase